MATLQVNPRVGRPLLVEKPLVFDLPEAEIPCWRRRRGRNLFFAINFNHRFARPVQLARQASLAGGELGVFVWVRRRGDSPGEAGGAATIRTLNLIETQCHGFDLLEYLMRANLPR